MADGLVQPWSIAFLPGGDVLITERPGRLRIVRGGKLLPTPVAGVPTVVYAGQGGLLEVAPHPNFATNRLLYLTYSKTKADGSGRDDRSGSRHRSRTIGSANVQQLFESVSTGRGHFGGKIAFDGNGFLFLTLGDRQVPPEGNLEAHPAQDLTEPPRQARAAARRRPRAGRQPVREARRREARDLELRPPQRAGHRHRSGHRRRVGQRARPAGRRRAQPHPAGQELRLAGDRLRRELPHRQGDPRAARMREGMEQPLHLWVPSIGISGAMFYTGDRFPQWKGNSSSAAWSASSWAASSSPASRCVSRETLLPGVGRIRDVRQGPDGFIYLVTEDEDGKPTPVVRLEPVEPRHVEVGAAVLASTHRPRDRRRWQVAAAAAVWPPPSPAGRRAGASTAPALDAQIGRIFHDHAYDAAGLRPGALAARWRRLHHRRTGGPGGVSDIVRYDAATGARSVLVAGLAADAAGPTARRSTIADYVWSADGARLLIFTNTSKVWRQNTRGDYWVLDLASGRLTQAGRQARPASSLMFAKFSPDAHARRLRARQQPLRRAARRRPRHRSSRPTGSETIINGTSDWVYEEELGVRDGFRWSPDGRRIAYWQFDTTGVGIFTLINNTDTLYPVVTTHSVSEAGHDELRGAHRRGRGRRRRRRRWMKTPGDPRNTYLARLDWHRRHHRWPSSS